MRNADTIRNFTDEQLKHFLWTWGINHTASFLKDGGTKLMNPFELDMWLNSEDFIRVETKVNPESSFGQDFIKKDGAE